MGQTPFKITFGTPPPIIPSLQSEFLAELDDQDVLDSIYDCNGPTSIYDPNSGPYMNLLTPANPTGSSWKIGSSSGVIGRGP